MTQKRYAKIKAFGNASLNADGHGIFDQVGKIFEIHGIEKSSDPRNPSFYIYKQLGGRSSFHLSHRDAYLDEGEWEVMPEGYIPTPDDNLYVPLLGEPKSALMRYAAFASKQAASFLHDAPQDAIDEAAFHIFHQIVQDVVKPVLLLKFQTIKRVRPEIENAFEVKFETLPPDVQEVVTLLNDTLLAIGKAVDLEFDEAKLRA